MEPYYDQTRGWVGLRGHQVIDLASTDESPLLRNREMREQLAIANCSLAGTPGALTFTAIRFDMFLVGRMRARQVTIRWDRGALDNQRRVLFLMVSSGSVGLRGDGPVRASDDGGIAVALPGVEPVFVEVPGSAEFLFFSFHESVTPSAKITTENLGKLSPTDYIFQATYAYLSTLINSRPLVLSPQSDVMRESVHAMARALAAVSVKDERSVDLFLRARQIILDECDNPALGAKCVADRLGTSLRTLFRVFSGNGTTVLNEIRAARLNRVVDLLRSDPSIPTEQLAARAGFTSTSSLRRALNVEYQVSLRALRAQSRLN